MNSKEIEKLKGFIYKTLISFDVNGNSIPCKTRGLIEDKIIGFVQALQPKEDHKDKISRLTNFNDELFELAYDNCNGLAHDELYNIVAKYKLPQPPSKT